MVTAVPSIYAAIMSLSHRKIDTSVVLIEESKSKWYSSAHAPRVPVGDGVPEGRALSQTKPVWEERIRRTADCGEEYF